VFAAGTAAALTGPIARGDAEVVRSQLAALSSADPKVADVYRALGTLALDLSERQGSATPASLEQIRSILDAALSPTSAR
jgi:predicted short-subunit dehydrogenase-like oxidoreductase (DUF2520 family)